MPEENIEQIVLEPLFAPWDEPGRHRARGEGGGGAEVRQGRRPSGQILAQQLRGALKEWRDSGYPGVSGTTRHLLNYWFLRSHEVDGHPFRYYFCQREAVETFIYLKEMRGLHCLSQIIAEFGGANAEAQALGITEEEDAWGRYAFKMATGSGKTKVMTLCIVWSYFHALRETGSEMAQHFVMIAPNLTVFERLREDFRPEGGGSDIFDKDPLIPPEWRRDWNVSTVLQDEAGGATSGGVIYLTNIHRLYPKRKSGKTEAESYDWMGPAVSKASALDTGEALRDRITAHKRVMILNDEAHHVWDPDSAWNEAIETLHTTLRKRGGSLIAQLDFSATPKDNKANYFKHIICDTPLGEAVDAGIVKTPVIGSVGELKEQASDDASVRYEMHLQLGYERWLKSRKEWAKSGKKALLFIMCNDTEEADQITHRLQTDTRFSELNDRTINLHTNLKGKVKKVGKGNQATQKFEISDKEISDEDLKALRKLSRELDSGESPYYCIVSVLMLREGWDVRNVTTIVPLRPYSSKAGILPEQTLGRGLRRMTPAGPEGANELVAVVEHPAFSRLYRDELAQEGLPLGETEVEKVPSTTVSIFPDRERKDVEKLEIAVPRLSAEFTQLTGLAPISEEELQQAFLGKPQLRLGEQGSDVLHYKERHLITNEVLHEMEIHLPLLSTGVGAVSFYVRELEFACKVKGSHAILSPLIQLFFEEMLFGAGHSIFDPNLVKRLGDADVRENVRATFLALIRQKTVQSTQRLQAPEPILLSQRKPYQVTMSERRPAKPAEKTLFNLVPCDQGLEVAFTEFCDVAEDVAAFAKNAGPQALRIDYLAVGNRLAFYTPDFFVRTANGKCYLVETKGRVDKDVPRKAKAAVNWCKTAKWEYVYVAEGIFQGIRSANFEMLVASCKNSLNDLLVEEDGESELPLFVGIDAWGAEAMPKQSVVDGKILEELPEHVREAVEEALFLYGVLEKKEGASLAPVFTPLLGVMDRSAMRLIKRYLEEEMPSFQAEQNDWFFPYLGTMRGHERGKYEAISKNLRKTLVYQSGVSPLGLLRSCLDYALNDSTKLDGVFASIKETMRFIGGRDLLDQVQHVNDFRNQYVAHQSEPLEDANQAKMALKEWVMTLSIMWDICEG